APPTVTITSPADQAVVQPGNPIPLTVNASDSDGTITKVEFFAGGTKLGESSSAPFTFSWSNAISGSYTITAKATDNAAASAVSAPIHLRVNALPAVALTAPAQGATYRAGDAVPVSANATDSDDGITKVEFFTGGTKIGEANAAPYSVNWAGAPEGASTLTARATDGSGASATSAAVTINVTRINTQLTVDAGPDRLISLPGSAALEGQVLSNGGTPGPDVVLAWSVVSGPGAVTFSTPNSSATSAAFTQPGNYIIQLTASNADGANFDTTAVTVLPAVQAGPDSPISNQGREFWMAFLSQPPPGGEPDHAGAFLTISSEVAATGTVEINGIQRFGSGWQTYRDVMNFAVEAGQKTVVAVEGFWPLRYDDQYDQALPTSVHIVANAPVAVQALSSSDFTTDGSLILPNSLLGRDYLVMSYRNYPGSNGRSALGGTQLAVVATKEQTQVTITPTAATTTHPVGQPFTVTLQRGEVYRMINEADGAGDFTGTRVQADKPVAVFGGHTCANVPASTPYCDHLYEQMPPVDFWGRHFVTLPLKTRTGGDRFRMLAAHDATRISVNGEIVAILNRGEFFETVLSEPSTVISDQQILLAQFAQSSTYDHTTGDPFLMVIPPYETFGRHYILNTQKLHSFYTNTERDIFDSYINIAVDSAHTSEVTINGQPIAASAFVPISGSGFSGATISVPKDTTFNISSPAPIGAWIYGWAAYESYGFTGGMYGAIDHATASFQLTQTADTALVGSVHHVRAALLNLAGLPVQDARVDFSVAGTNPVTGSDFTAADGTVEISWQGAQAGSDILTATTGTLSATTSVLWVTQGANHPPQVNAGSDALVQLGQPLALHGVVQDDGLPA
ncbi:MAG TPA: Ig-like domain-containing protein, partial [Chthoniobacterales bacterium]|nr:Ig-like domain-containing protein [Chthoniobacterales bacterium]